MDPGRRGGGRLRRPLPIAGRRTLAGLRERPRPTLILWGEADNALPVVLADLLTAALEVERPPTRLPAGHYLQEDQGPAVGRLIADWLAGEPT